MELYLVRHTTPDVLPGTCYGQTDLDVAASFGQELTAVQAKLMHLPQAVVYSSPLQRCLKLATASAEALNLGEVTQDARLLELHFGEWEMQAWNDIPRGLIDVWAEEHVMQSPPQGESFHALHARAKSFLGEVSANECEAPVLVFTHAGVIRALVAEALNLPLMHAFRLQIDYASVTHIIVDAQVTRIGFVNR